MTDATFDPREFIARAAWKLSTTTVDKPNWRHFYIVQAHYPDDPDFQRFADLIASEGYDATFERIRYRYLRVDDFLYWASRSLFAPGQNLNRRPASDVAGLAAHEQAALPI